MEVHAPTLAKLNKPQKRALILRDQLRYTEAPHLDTFLKGIGREEPPAYKLINGAVYPSLVMVTLKDSAIRFDLGNVHFQTDIILEPGIYHAYLTVENGRFEIRTEEALPEDEANLETVPIIAFIAKNMVPMFEAKFKAIFARMEQVNAIRQAAFDSVNKPVQQFQEGEVRVHLVSVLRTSHSRSFSPCRPCCAAWILSIHCQALTRPRKYLEGLQDAVSRNAITLTSFRSTSFMTMTNTTTDTCPL
jgi:hypothetical protein